ncbi:MAG: hypothetical protein JNM99_14770 [Verrucomicrobiaceae bacterium]|nr:hypothetical protein [Verrucomicrobiaceae bacterium]
MNSDLEAIKSKRFSVTRFDPRPRSLLSKFRSNFGRWLQLITLVVWVLNPFNTVRAVWVPDATTGLPGYWVSVAGEPEVEPDTSQPTDADGNPTGPNVWYGQFLSALLGGIAEWTEGNVYWIQGTEKYYAGGAWHMVPGNGELPTSTIRYHTSLDADHDGIPDDVDPVLNDPNNGNDDYLFLSVSDEFLIDGKRQVYVEGAWHDAGTVSSTAKNAHPKADADSDGIPDDIDPYASSNSNNSMLWQGGGHYIDEVEKFYCDDGMWHANPDVDNVIIWTGYLPATDSDEDQIPDAIDPYPDFGENVDVNLTRFYFKGGKATLPVQIQRNGVTITKTVPLNFREGYYWKPATFTNGQQLSDGTPIPDNAITEAMAGATILHWDGGAVWLNGSYNTFPPCDYVSYHIIEWIDDDGDGNPDAYQNSTGQRVEARGILADGSPDFSLDTDGDGLPDAIDPYPGTVVNGCTFLWGGGTFMVDGQWQQWVTKNYPGLPGWENLDADGDGIPDALDPYPDEAGNRSLWFQGGTFSVDGQLTAVNEKWVPASVDPMSSAYVWNDADGDGIPVQADPYPLDINNNSFWFTGGTALINGEDQELEAGWVRGNCGGSVTMADSFRDDDGDGIPNTVDSYPQDNLNGNFWFPGSTFTIDGVPTWIGPQWVRASTGPDSYASVYDYQWLINSTWQWLPSYDPRRSSAPQSSHPTNQTVHEGFSDSDGDQIPNQIDPYPSNKGNWLNGIVTFQWNGGGPFIINGESVTFESGRYPGMGFNDPDGDSIPDGADPYPLSAANNSSQWHSGPCYWEGQYYPGGLSGWHRANVTADMDGDTIPDDVDTYPDDHYNNTHYTWPEEATTILVADVAWPVTPTDYQGLWSDSDGDGIPDPADPLPVDPYNGNDTDGDGIPDWIEVATGILDRNLSNDSSNLRSDSISYLQAYNYSKQFSGPTDPAAYLSWIVSWLINPMNTSLDSDQDRMPDVYEVLNGLDPHNWRDAAESRANDLLFNVEKYVWGVPLNQACDPATYHSFANGPSFSSSLAHYHADASAHNDPSISTPENDWDGDGVGNVDELMLLGTDPRNVDNWEVDGSLKTSLISLLSGHLNLFSGSESPSATTLINWGWLIQNVTCSCGGSSCAVDICSCGGAQSAACTGGGGGSCSCGGLVCVGSGCACGGSQPSICGGTSGCSCGGITCQGQGCTCTGSPCGGGPPCTCPSGEGTCAQACGGVGCACDPDGDPTSCTCSGVGVTNPDGSPVCACTGMVLDCSCYEQSQQCELPESE